MKQQQPVIALVLLLAHPIVAPANSLFEAEQRHRLQLLHSTTSRNMHLSPLDRAYVDAHNVLGGDTQCSQFFGGKASRQVLDELVIRLRPRLINDSRIGIRMSGLFTSLFEPQTGISYRLFEQAEINSIGAFYKSKVFSDDNFVPNVGRFRPNTRAARLLILLHELAHLIQGPNGMWLIPDDGGNPELSRENTITVESQCREQIRAL